MSEVDEDWNTQIVNKKLSKIKWKKKHNQKSNKKKKKKTRILNAGETIFFPFSSFLFLVHILIVWIPYK